MSESRRRVLGIVGAAALTSLAPLFARAAPEPPVAGPKDKPLEVVLGQLGPKLIAVGAIDPGRFAQACASAGAGAPLDATRAQALQTGSDAPMVFDASNAHFLLNFFWAVGLANVNPILTRGPMVQSGLANVANYASTGGWTLASRPVMDVYARTPVIVLTVDQQRRLEEVASNVFRPCCDNPTSFPDCNHGMAMLGLLAHIAAEGSDVDALFVVAKAANAFWFPQQSGRLARYVQASRGVDYARFDAREAGSRALFSGSGFRTVESWLTEHGLGGTANGASCAA